MDGPRAAAPIVLVHSTSFKDSWTSNHATMLCMAVYSRSKDIDPCSSFRCSLPIFHRRHPRIRGGQQHWRIEKLATEGTGCGCSLGCLVSLIDTLATNCQRVSMFSKEAPQLAEEGEPCQGGTAPHNQWAPDDCWLWTAGRQGYIRQGLRCLNMTACMHGSSGPIWHNCPRRLYVVWYALVGSEI